MTNSRKVMTTSSNNTLKRKEWTVMVGKTKKKILCMLCSFCLLFLNVFVVSAEDGEEFLARQRKNYTANLTETMSFGQAEVEISAEVGMWSDGPYAQINKVIGNYVAISPGEANVKFDGFNLDIWSSGEQFPTTKLMYAFNAMLVAEVTANTPKSVVKELTDAGFVKDEKVGSTTYYRRSVDETGILSLY